MKASTTAFWLVAVLVVAGYFISAGVGGSEWGHADPRSLYYDALVRGFGAGHLSLEKTAPPGLAQLPDPYDPAANARYLYAPYQLNDLSYYRGKFYLYFGVTPALLLFWPWFALTGDDLPHKYAAAAFCSAGFLIAAGLLRAIWRRYFPAISGWVVAAGALALGFATTTIVMLQRPGVSEVPIGCAYAMDVLTLAAIWRALHDPGREVRWLAAAGVAYGLALGARPSELPGIALLLVPVLFAARGPASPAGRRLAAAGIPLAAAVAGLLLYNYLRFDAPFEFGQRYQLAAERQGAVRHFSFGYLAYNVRLYFLAPTAWGRFFPFIRGTVAPALPSGHAPPENVVSVLPNLPLVFLALAVPLAWRRRPASEAGPLRAFLLATGLLFVLLLPPLLLYYWTSNRYEVEFLPPLILLAIVGILGLERVLAERPRERAVARTAWVVLLGFSVAFNLLASCGRYASERYSEGLVLDREGRRSEAAAKFTAALRLDPGFAEAWVALGDEALALRQSSAAVADFRSAVAIRPDSGPAHALLGGALDGAGRAGEALAEYRAAARLDPDDPAVHNNLGIALARLGRVPEAAAEFASAIRLKPNFAQAHANLGNVSVLLGRLPEAIDQYEEALRLNPDDPELRLRLDTVRRAYSEAR